jgi:hypothetical protein
MREGQRLQQNSVDHTENGAVGADADRKRKDRDGSKHGRARKPPDNQPDSHM